MTSQTTPNMNVGSSWNTRCSEESFRRASSQTGSGVAGIVLGAGSWRNSRSMVVSSTAAAKSVFHARIPMRQSVRPTKPMYLVGGERREDQDISTFYEKNSG